MGNMSQEQDLLTSIVDAMGCVTVAQAEKILKKHGHIKNEGYARHIVISLRDKGYADLINNNQAVVPIGGSLDRESILSLEVAYNLCDNTDLFRFVYRKNKATKFTDGKYAYNVYNINATDTRLVEHLDKQYIDTYKTNDEGKYDVINVYVFDSGVDKELIAKALSKYDLHAPHKIVYCLSNSLYEEIELDMVDSLEALA